MTKLASKIIAEIATNSTADQVGELIRELHKCGTRGAIATAIGVHAPALLIPAVLLVGCTLLLERH